MLAHYVKVKVSTNGKAKLISFEIPGVSLQFLQIEGCPLEAFGAAAGHSIENLVSAAKYGIDCEMARLAGVRYVERRIGELEQVKAYIDKLVTMDQIDSIKKNDSRVANQLRLAHH